MKPNVEDLFNGKKPIIGCIHLLPLPGSPLYEGKVEEIYNRALKEAEIFENNDIDGLIIENFRDYPFYSDDVPPETVSSMAAVGREIVNNVSCPVGVNVLRNDGEAALAVATSIAAQFIRVNVHSGVAVTAEGIIEGKAHKTLRLKSNLNSDVAILADIDVKHANPLKSRSLETEAEEMSQRGMVDGIIVSGEMTGKTTEESDVERVKKGTNLPIIVGSGTTPDNFGKLYPRADGFIVGSYFKEEGNAGNTVDENRVREFMKVVNQLRE